MNQTNILMRDLASLYKNDMLRFLIFLSTTDGTISEDEVEFINTLLEKRYTSEKILLTLHDTTADDFIKSIPASAEYFLHTKNMSGTFYCNHYYTIEALYIESFETIGHAFIACNKEVLSSEIDFLTKYTMNLSSYIENHRLDKCNSMAATSKDNTSNLSSIDSEKNPKLYEVSVDFNSLIGLDNIKKNILSIIHMLKVNEVRVSRGLKGIALPKRFIFIGNHGTGKSLAASYLCNICYEAGILKSNTFLEIDRTDLIVGSVKDTIDIISHIIHSVNGGLLFIDDIYSIVEDSDNPSMKTTLDLLINAIDDYPMV